MTAGATQVGEPHRLVRLCVRACILMLCVMSSGRRKKTGADWVVYNQWGCLSVLYNLSLYVAAEARSPHGPASEV